MNWRGKIPALCFALAMIAAACGDSTADDTVAEAGDEASDVVSSSDASAADDAEATTSTTAAPTTASTVEETTTSVAAPEALAQVTVLDAGAEPRTELLLDIAEGTTETMVMSQRQKLVQEVGGQPLQELEVSTITKQELTTTSTDNGFKVVSVVTSSEAGPDADPASAAQVTDGLQAMIGVTTQIEIDRRGNLLASEISGTEALDQATQELMQSTAQVSIPFPAEPVGVGAQWEVSQPISLGGIPTVQTAIYTLKSIDGSVLTIDTTTEQVVEPGSTFAQGGIEIEVISWTNTGGGTMTMDLTSLVPTSVATSSAVQELAIPGSDDPLTQTVDVTIEVSSE